MSANALPPLAKRDLDLILNGTRELWEQARGQRIFITGGTGFFGCWLVESFCHISRELRLGAQAMVLTRDATRFAAKCPHLASDPAVTLYAGDVRSFDFPEGEFQFAVHAATQSTAPQTSDEMLSTIVDGTRRVLEFARTHRTKRFLFTSSGAVYGKQPPDISHLPESYLPQQEAIATDAYAKGKLRAETLCAEMTGGTEVEAAIARCWAFCGPHLALDAHFAVGNFIGDAIAGRPIAISGDGTPRRSYLYAADLAVWLWTMLFRAPALVPMNVGSAHDVSIRELAETVMRTLSPGEHIHVAKQPAPGAPISRYVPDVNRAGELLSLRETVGLEEQIRRTAEWHGFTPRV
ncbi:MAG TPA: NAD(P)-dependent oxidoreductase [Acidobacteriaceae bacterium]|nr:NAD(P)-dependent oxidoreductase [Acidobacteriaceae bacterium]